MVILPARAVRHLICLQKARKLLGLGLGLAASLHRLPRGLRCLLQLGLLVLVLAGSLLGLARSLVHCVGCLLRCLARLPQELAQVALTGCLLHLREELVQPAQQARLVC